MMNRRHLLMAAGVLVAGWFAFFADKTPPGEIAAASPGRGATATAKPAAAAPTASSAKNQKEPVLLALLPREGLIGGDFGAGRADALFNSQSWTPPPPPAAAVKAGPPPAPQAPRLPYKYIGRKQEDNRWEIYLSRGEETFIARAHGVLEGVWRVDSVSAQAVSFTYLPLKKTQRLAIGGTD